MSIQKLESQLNDALNRATECLDELKAARKTLRDMDPGERGFEELWSRDPFRDALGDNISGTAAAMEQFESRLSSYHDEVGAINGPPDDTDPLRDRLEDLD